MSAMEGGHACYDGTLKPWSAEFCANPSCWPNVAAVTGNKTMQCGAPRAAPMREWSYCASALPCSEHSPVAPPATVPGEREPVWPVDRREVCVQCGEHSAVGFTVPDDVWSAVFGDGVLCLRCFTGRADLARLRWDKDITFWPVSRATNDEPTAREGLCERCDREYVGWYAPNELWNRVMGYHGAGFLCAQCFTLEAERMGVKPTAWVIREEGDADRELQSELSFLRARVEQLIQRPCAHADCDQSEPWTDAEEAEAEAAAEYKRAYETSHKHACDLGAKLTTAVNEIAALQEELSIARSANVNALREIEERRRRGCGVMVTYE